jgi:hypothetical protein
MDELLNQFESFKITSNIRVENEKLVATKTICENEIIGKINSNAKMKYFWEVYPDDKTISINDDIVLDITNDTSIIRYIIESPYDFNCVLHYDCNYKTGNIDINSLQIIAIKPIYPNDTIILKYSML